MAVDQRVGDVVGALLGVEDVHRGECLVVRTDADDLLCHFYSVGVLGVETCYEGVCLPRLHHHHAEIVALEHLVVGFLEGVALALALGCQQLCEVFAASALPVVAQVDNLYAVERQVQFLRLLGYHLLVAEQYRVANAFRACRHCRLYHGGVQSFGEDDALRMLACSVVEILREFRFLSEQLAQAALVSVPVINRFACHAALDSCLCDRRTHLCDEARVYRFRYKIFGSEGQVIDMIDLIDHVGHRLLGQIGYGEHRCHLHFFVDCRRVNVECAAEDVGEAYDIVYLVGVVRASCGHQHIGSARHGILVGYLRHGVGEGEDDRFLCH